MKDYYKIGEISKIYGIGRDSLMYYEELGILNPFRDQNGYRIYSISDIWRLNLIKELRSLDFSVKKIKAYLDDRDINSTTKILKEETKLIEQKILNLMELKANINNRISYIETSTKQNEFNEIKLVYLKERKGLSLNADIKRDEEFDFLIQKLQNEYENKFSILGKNNIGAIFDIESIKEGRYNEYKSLFCFLEDTKETYDVVLEEGYYTTINYKGSYKNNKKYLDKIKVFIEKNNYKIKKEPIEIYKIDIHETAKVEEFITEIQILIEK